LELKFKGKFMFLESTGNKDNKRGWIEVVCGCMFSGKTEELIRRMKRAEFAQQRVEIFKPQIDVRYSKDDVVSHNKTTIPSTPVAHSSQILLLANDVEVIGIDEAQFFDDGLPDVCVQLANQGVRVIVAGLDLDFKGRPFGPIPHLLALAEYVTKVHAICIKTGNHAHHSYRMTDSDKVVQLGEKEMYMPLSREAYNEAMAAKVNGTSKKIDDELIAFVEEVDRRREEALVRRTAILERAALAREEEEESNTGINQD